MLRTALKITAIIPLIIIAAIMIGAKYVGDNPSFVPLDEPQGSNVLLFETDGDVTYLVTAGESCRFRQINGDGVVENSFSLNSGTKRAVIFGESLYTFAQVNNKILYFEYNMLSGEIENKVYIPVNMSTVELITCDISGKVFLTIIDEPNILRIFDVYGAEIVPVQFDNGIDFMDSCDQCLYVHSGGVLYKFTDDMDINNAYSAYCDVVPSCFLSEDFFVDNTGDIFTTEPKKVFSTGTIGDISSSPNRLNNTHCADYEGFFYSMLADGSCKKYDSEGETLVTYKSQGVTRGVSSNGIICEVNSTLTYMPLGSFELIKDETDEPTPPNGLEIDGNCIIVPIGKTVAAFKKEFGLDVYLNGNIVATGLCKSGMTANIGTKEYFLVIKGDVNGTGTVNTADIKIIQQIIIGKKLPTEWEKCGADVNCDSFITTSDIIAIIKK